MIALLLALAVQPPDPSCIWNQNTMGGNVVTLPAARRAVSPQDSVTFQAGGATVKVCYSRPSLRGRHMVGGEAVPFGRIWRTGANEPTMIHTTGHLVIAGIHVDAGTYALYTVPGEQEWEIVVNRAHTQWGEESNYTAAVQAQEVGRGRVAAQRPAQPVEQFTIRAEPGAGGDAVLVLEWENARVAIPFNRMR
jgi:hypothetical protein